MGIPANIAFDGLWMVGQKWAWSSPDGLTWTGYPKKDWGERISISYFVFDNKLWGAGGMMYDQPQTGFLNDIWNSADGKEWLQVCKKAEWQPRRSSRIITFRNRLWLFGGAIESDAGKGPRHFLNDVWSSQDGIKWRQMTGATNWDPRSPGHILVFKDRLWMIGSDGNTEIWRSDDGVSWVQVASQTPWRTRAAYGTMVFDLSVWSYCVAKADPAPMSTIFRYTSCIDSDQPEIKNLNKPLRKGYGLQKGILGCICAARSWSEP